MGNSSSATSRHRGNQIAKEAVRQYNQARQEGEKPGGLSKRVDDARRGVEPRNVSLNENKIDTLVWRA